MIVRLWITQLSEIRKIVAVVVVVVVVVVAVGRQHIASRVY
jgi:hypothetical protein